jgi:hypothetical protein
MADLVVRPGRIHGRDKLPKDTVRLGIVKKKRAKKPQAAITIGEEVMDNLRWQEGDKIDILFNDNIVVLRRLNKGLWSVRREVQTGRFVVNFTVQNGPGFTSKTLRGREDVPFAISNDELVVSW